MKTKPTFSVLCKLQYLNKCLLLSAFCFLLSTSNIFAQPITFTPEDCDPISIFPWTEGFEDNGLELPPCWEQQILNSDAWKWTIVPGSIGTPPTAYGGNYKARIYLNSAITPIYRTRLVTPVFDLSQLNTPVLNFWFAQKQAPLNIYYKNTPEGEWVLLKAIVGTTNWQEEFLLLPNKSTYYQIAFQAMFSGGNFQIQLDDISIFEIGPPALTYQVNISTNSGVSAAGAIVTLTNNDGNPDHIYTEISDENGVTFHNIFLGSYHLKITLPGHNDYIANNLIVSGSGLEYSAQLIETLVEPSANDTITIVWKGNSTKVFNMVSTAGEQYTIDWGDGSAIQTFTGNGYFQDHYRVYGPAEYYTATIAGTTPECVFTVFDCAPVSNQPYGYIYNQVTELYIHSCSALQKLDCRSNLISSLDLSANIALQFLDCSDNQLGNLDLHTNTALIELYCNVNQLTNLYLNNNTLLTFFACGANLLTVLDISNNTLLESLQFDYNQLTNIDISFHPSLWWLTCSNNLLTNLDLSSNTELELLYCDNNSFTHLDVSANTALRELRCTNNLLINLDLSTNTELRSLWCNDNRLSNLELNTNKLSSIRCFNNSLPLSNLYQISQQASAANKNLGTQILDTLNIMIGDIIDYSEQIEFGGIATVFVIEKNGLPAAPGEYSLMDGIITFHTNGNYTVTMTNTAIISNPPAKVIIEIIVDADISDAFLLILAVSESELSPAFNSDIYNYSVEVTKYVEEITITAIPRNSFATVTGTGTFALEFGENIFSVIVIAEDGFNELEYSITVNREMLSNDAALLELTVSEGELDPVFNSDIYNYSVAVTQYIEEITITAIPRNSFATVTGTGTFALEFGENIFSVIVNAEDDITKTEYLLTVNRMIGILELSNDLFRIFPNPTTGELIIEWTSKQVDEWTSIEIYDIFGKKMEIPHCVRNDVIPSVAQRSEESRINISHLHPGIYLIKITTEKGVITQKIIKY